MPDVDRHELIRRQAAAAAAGIPILVVSAHWDPGSPGVPGSDGFRSKPYDPPLLAETVACLVAGTAAGA